MRYEYHSRKRICY